jgi:hypothetical protein
MVNTIDHMPPLNGINCVVQRAQKIKPNCIAVEGVSSYNKIGSLLREIVRYNKGTTTALQLDSKGRYYCCFVSNPVFISVLSKNSGLEIDACFMKHLEYTGALIQMIAKAGDRRNIPLALAIVRSETADEYIWFFLKCVERNIPLYSVAGFSDRGKQILAHRRLADFGVVVYLKNCVHHIIRNVLGKFSTSKDLWYMMQ